MRMKKLIRKWIPGLLAAVLLLTPVKAYAADGDPIVDNGNGQIKAVYLDRNGMPIENMRVRIYRVADVSGKIMSNAVYGYDVSYQLTPEFQKYDENTGSVRVTGFSEQALNEALKVREGESGADRRARWQRIAGTLRSVAGGEVATRTVRTDANGVADFQGLSPGLYLLVAQGHLVQENDADWNYRYDPTFVSIPQFTGGIWDYGTDLRFADDNATLRQKYTYEEINYEYEIYKRWVVTEGVTPPAEVTVDLYCDDVYDRTIVLNEGNGWHYKWTGGLHSWRAEERMTGNDYSVTVEIGKASEFILTNTFNPPPPPPPPPPENPPPENPPPPEEPDILGVNRGTEDPAILGVRRGDVPDVLGARRLPQTGQLWWPVPLLAIGGTGLFGAGVIRRKRSQE